MRWGLDKTARRSVMACAVVLSGYLATPPAAQALDCSSAQCEWNLACWSHGIGYDYRITCWDISTWQYCTGGCGNSCSIAQEVCNQY